MDSTNTHINAFLQDATDARTKVLTALAEFDQAVTRLKEQPGYDKDAHAIRLPFEVLYPKDTPAPARGKEATA